MGEVESFKINTINNIVSCYNLLNVVGRRKKEKKTFKWMKMHYARNLYGYKLNNLCFIHEIGDNFFVEIFIL